MRKEMNLAYDTRITVTVHAPVAELRAAIQHFASQIRQEILSDIIEIRDSSGGEGHPVTIEEMETIVSVKPLTR